MKIILTQLLSTSQYKSYADKIIFILPTSTAAKSSQKYKSKYICFTSVLHQRLKCVKGLEFSKIQKQIHMLHRSHEKRRLEFNICYHLPHGK